MLPCFCLALVCSYMYLFLLFTCSVATCTCLLIFLFHVLSSHTADLLLLAVLGIQWGTIITWSKGKWWFCLGNQWSTNVFSFVGKILENSWNLFCNCLSFMVFLGSSSDILAPMSHLPHSSANCCLLSYQSTLPLSLLPAGSTPSTPMIPHVLVFPVPTDPSLPSSFFPSLFPAQGIGAVFRSRSRWLLALWPLGWFL